VLPGDDFPAWKMVQFDSTTRLTEGSTRRENVQRKRLRRSCILIGERASTSLVVDDHEFITALVNPIDASFGDNPGGRRRYPPFKPDRVVTVTVIGRVVRDPAPGTFPVRGRLLVVPEPFARPVLFDKVGSSIRCPTLGRQVEECA
jgi:hypothetical protein